MVTTRFTYDQTICGVKGGIRCKKNKQPITYSFINPNRAKEVECAIQKIIVAKLLLQIDGA